LLNHAGLSVALSGATIPRAFADEQVVGPVADSAKYVVSPRGVHLATVTGKGSRFIVIVDGVAGPKFDEIATMSAAFVDPRPYATFDPNSVPQPGPVVFSKDGSRFAYVGRQGEEWILMADNKEVMRVPNLGGAGNAAGANWDVRLEFTGASGQHLLFTRLVYGGNELWVDGQKWPGLFFNGGTGLASLNPLISPDGRRIACPVALDTRGEKRALIVDGADAGYYGEQLQFTPDSQHLISIGRSPKGQAVLIDGKPLFSARDIQEVFVPPVGNRFIFALTHFNKDGTARDGSFLLVDGKPVEATLTPSPSITRVIISPDGRHYAAICGSTPRQFVVIDGKKGQEYNSINAQDASTLAQGIAFSADSSKLAYSVFAGTKTFVVLNDDESDALGLNSHFWFSPDGKRFAYAGTVDLGNSKWVLMLDGKSQPLDSGWSSVNFTFSPDGSHFASGDTTTNSKGIFLDGKNTGIGGDFAFSPDSQHLAIVGFRGSDNKAGLFLDGQLLFESYDKPILQRAFSPDSRHLYWMAREPATGAKAGPGVYEYVVYADGKPAAHCDDIMGAMGAIRSLYGLVTVSSWKTPPTWNVNESGALVFLGPVESDLKRFTVSLPGDTNLDSLIADAKAAPARAAAAAAEARKQAAEVAAAKKAKADADAAAAAAKAKADYDAAVAKRKADYDAAVAKRKADYEAAVAKRKADYDAAVAAKAQQLKAQQQPQPSGN